MAGSSRRKRDRHRSCIQSLAFRTGGRSCPSPFDCPGDQDRWPSCPSPFDCPWRRCSTSVPFRLPASPGAMSVPFPVLASLCSVRPLFGSPLFRQPSGCAEGEPGTARSAVRKGPLSPAQTVPITLVWWRTGPSMRLRAGGAGRRGARRQTGSARLQSGPDRGGSRRSPPARPRPSGRRSRRRVRPAARR